MEPVRLEGFTVGIDPAEVRRFLGRSGSPPDGSGERLERALEGSLALAGELAAPKGIYTVAAGRELPGSKVFEGLEKVAFCVCTVGPAIESEVSLLSEKGSLLEALVLDSAGSVAAEEVAGYMEGEIGRVAEGEGLRISCRASPGYGDWDIREQGAIFSLLPAELIGVRLTERYMMVPRKSVSFAVQIAERPRRMRSENSCRNCDRGDCPYRLLD